jgi:hypothetical protein
LLLLLLATSAAFAKQHSIAFGKPLSVKLFVGPAEDKTQEMKVRGLYVDGKLREFTTGEPHDVTDQSFVVRRVFRVNDVLPEDPKKVPQWKWQRGGWLLVERASGRVARLELPDFDPYYSNASWFRDYAAYCGLSGDAEKVYAMVVQLGQKKPLTRKLLGAARGEELPDSECAPPKWQRAPVRVTFEPAGKPPVTFSVRGRWVELAPESDTPEPDNE